MRDGQALRAVKFVARQVVRVELWARRLLLKRHGWPRYRLAGTCNGCGRCCEAPSIQVGRSTWHVRSLRALFLWWQWRVNGFKLAGSEPRTRTFIFDCTHFDRATKQCDSYSSRPMMCRDYPTNHTFEAVPALFEECSYKVVDRKAAELKAAMLEAGVEPEKLKEIEKKLFLDE